MLFLALPFQALAAVGTFACSEHGSPVTLEQSLDDPHAQHMNLDHDSDTQDNAPATGCECVTCSPASYPAPQSDQMENLQHLLKADARVAPVWQLPDGLFRPPI